MKKNLFPSFIPLILFFACSGITISLIVMSCNKEDKSNLKFGIASVKEWWYGSFVKTPEYNAIDWKSPVAPPSGSSTKKYLKWNSAIEYNKDGMDIVEVPIVYETNYIILPRKGNLKNTLIGERMAKATVHRAIFVKNGRGKTIVRILTFIPNETYLEKSRNKINFPTYKDGLNTFEGSVVIKKWDEKVLSIIEFENGKGKKLNIVRAEGLFKKGENQKLTTQNCNWVETPTYTWVCVVVPTGDDVADDERCQENGQWVETGTTYEYQCVEVDEDVLFEGCLQEGGSSQDCNCIFLGIDCDGGGENPPPITRYSE